MTPDPGLESGLPGLNPAGYQRCNSHNAERMARHWRGTMMAAVGAPEVITQLESAAKVLMVRNAALFYSYCRGG